MTGSLVGQDEGREMPLMLLNAFKVS